MNAKLTLSIDTTTIAAAKQKAQEMDVSLSSLVEIYLSYLTKNRSTHKSLQNAPITQSLVGVVNIPKETSVDDLKYQYLKEKYL